MTTAEVAEEMGFSADELAAAAELLGLPEREEPDVYLPSAEAIRIETAIIRSRWTAAELESRIVGPRRGRIKDATEHDNAGGGASSHRGQRGEADASPR